MKKIIKQYSTDILWALLVTLFELSCLTVCLFLIVNYIPHEISWLPTSFLSWFVLLAIYRVITYKLSNNNISQPDIPSGYNSTPYKDSTDQPIPVRNVIPIEEADELDREHSVRE